MSDMQPIGTPLTLLDGVERRVLFTLSVVDEVQDKFDLTVPEVFELTGDKKRQSEVTGYLVTTLINHAIKRENQLNGTNCKPLTEEYVRDNIDMVILPKIHRAIARSYGYSVPEPDEDDYTGKEPDPQTEPNS